MFKMQIALILLNRILGIPEGFSSSQCFPLFDYALYSGRTAKILSPAPRKSHLKGLASIFPYYPSQPLFLRYFWMFTSTISRLWTMAFQYFSLGSKNHKISKPQLHTWRRQERSFVKLYVLANINQRISKSSYETPVKLVWCIVSF